VSWLKRTIDVVVSFVLVLVALPVMAMVALVIGFAMGRPVLLKQVRPGRNGVPFSFFKFRTMTDARSADGELLPDELRLTSLGKLLRATSLDELPQLINVVKGDMSLVGPRPLLMEYLPLYSPEQARRHEVRPGITGWAQVNGRNAISWEERLKLDVWYVDHQSLALDMRVLWLTLLRVIRRHGVNQPGHATMSKFRGTGSD
jgi:sugar transferase EpsL